MSGAPVTRAEFDRLIMIVSDLAQSIRSHVHELHDIDGGGETLKPDRWCDDEITLIVNRLAQLATEDTDHAGR